MPALVRILLLAITSAAGVAPAQPPALASTAPELEVPFVVSSAPVTRTMLDMAKVTAQDFVIDLGSGDGRIVFLAAQHYGARALGVEIDPRLVETAQEDARKFALERRVDFRREDLFTTDLSSASVITMYLLPDVNLALRPRLLALKPGTRIVSHDWDMGDWTADETRTVSNPEKSVGREKTSRVMLWVVPARIQGK